MKYDFTTVYDRRGMDALAVDALGQPGGFARRASLRTAFPSSPCGSRT